ncbi:MAG: hypothetical protein H6618_09150 [Deltaproteobacteria bacterium]|nr:hypothetical protein [Deltaproteobacteria bacterium]
MKSINRYFISEYFISCMTFFVLFSCKKNNVRPTENLGSVVHQTERIGFDQTSSLQKIREDNFIDMHLFDDGEQLIFFKSDFISGSDEDLDIKSLYYREYLNLLASEAFSEPDELNLNSNTAVVKRLVRESSGPDFKKGLIRLFESLQDKLRKIRFGSDYKQKYFNKAIDKKRVQVSAGEYSAYDRMPALSTT